MSTVAEQPAATTPKDQQLQQRAQVVDALTKRGIDEYQWRTLMNSLFPGARSESVLMVIDYCHARKLDPMKKPCHIVPMRVKDQKTGEWEWRDVVMPGIYEYRTTAMRTGNYLGHSKPEYGPTVECFGVTAPEWCEMTMYRRATNGDRIEFPVRVYFREACATKFDKEAKKDVANDRWSKAPIQMLTKTTEAAGLREAFPDEFGGETTAEEMDGRGHDVVDVQPVPAIQVPQRRADDVAQPSSAPVIDAEPVSEPTPAPAPQAASTITITKVEKMESSKTRGKTDEQVAKLGARRVFYFLVTDSTGRVCSTWSESLYLQCGKFADDKTPVDITAETVSGQPWPKLVEVNAAKGDAQ